MTQSSCSSSYGIDRTRSQGSSELVWAYLLPLRPGRRSTILLTAVSGPTSERTMSHQHTFGRREWLKAAAGAGLGAGWAADQVLGARTSRTPRGQIRSCVVLFYYGGPSHLDTL